MDKKFILVEGIRIAYLEENDHPGHNTIFFVHGNSVSSRTWRKQFADPSFRDYRLVSIDLPSHGDSGAAANPYQACTLPQLGLIMAKTLQLLTNGHPYMLAGVSLSTNIAAEMLAFDIDPKGLVLAGPSIIGTGIPVENIIKPGTHVNVVFTDEPDLGDVKSYAGETSLSGEEDDLRVFMEDFQAVQSPFRSALAQSIGNKDYGDEIALLRQKSIPLLVVFGKDEKVIENSYLDEVLLPLWGEQIFKIPGASHLVHIDQPEAFNKLVKDFAEDCFR